MERMIKGVFISEELANEIRGLEYTDSVKFNPVQDEDGRWFVSEIEGEHLDGAGSLEPLFRYTLAQRTLRMQRFIELQEERGENWINENEEMLSAWLQHGGNLEELLNDGTE